MGIGIDGIDEAIDRFESAGINLREYVSAELKLVCQDIVRYASMNAPRVTGEYADSIYWEQLAPLQFRIGARDWKAAMIEFGTEPHPIYPRSAITISSRERKKAGKQQTVLSAKQGKGASVLHFFIGGEEIFCRYVLRHPGTLPQLIIHDAKIAHLDQITEAIMVGVRNALAAQGR